MNTFASFKGSTALITGASSGIGMGFARELASHGIHLIITARSEQMLQDLADELKTKYQINVDVIVLDLTESLATKNLMEQVQKLDKTVDILINNAGFGKWTEFLTESLQSYQQMLTLNMNVLVDLTYLFLPRQNNHAL